MQLVTKGNNLHFSCFKMKNVQYGLKF